MAQLKNTTIDDTGFLQLPTGTTAQRPSLPEPGHIRFNTTLGVQEYWNGTNWIHSLGILKETPATSGHQLAQESPYLPSGSYWIKSSSMPNPLLMYVDMTYEGGGYDFLAFQGNGINPEFVNSTNSGTALGLDLVYPRSKEHWRAMSDYVRNILGDSTNNYFRGTYAIHRINANGNGGSGNYTGFIMRDPNSYGSGAPDWRVPDGGRWWLRDTTFSEPNGDYTAFGFIGGYTFPNPYTGQDLGFNDVLSTNAAYANYRPGSYYLVSTNAKP